MARYASEKDVLLLGFGGRCEPKLSTYWFEQNFRGTVVSINGEEPFNDGNAWQNPANVSTVPKNQYHIGYVADGCQSQRILFMAQFILRQRELWQFFLQENNKPASSRERFLVYTNGNCVDFRQNTFDAIALANPLLKVEHASHCSGNMQNITNVVKFRLPRGVSYQSNWKFMRNFRFCLVMDYRENFIGICWRMYPVANCSMMSRYNSCSSSSLLVLLNIMQF